MLAVEIETLLLGSIQKKSKIEHLPALILLEPFEGNGRKKLVKCKPFQPQGFSSIHSMSNQRRRLSRVSNAEKNRPDSSRRLSGLFNFIV